MRANGHQLSVSTVERAMRRRELLQPVDYTGERRELAKARKAAFADPHTGPTQVWQMGPRGRQQLAAWTWAAG